MNTMDIGRKYRAKRNEMSVILIDSYGDDARIVEAARVSYKGAKSKRDDRHLIDYLMRHRHTSPFEMVDFIFKIECPIFVARQWMRHRTASINEISGRYTKLDNGFYIPPNNRVRQQSTANKQGSGERFTYCEAADVMLDMETVNATALQTYDKHLEMGVARETARMTLTVSTMTEFYWKVNLHNLFHFLKLRSSKHAQEEIRVLALDIENIVSEVVPIAYAAWVNHVKEAVTLSKDEQYFIMQLIDAGLHDEYPDIDLEDEAPKAVNMFIERAAEPHLRKSRRGELIQKILAILDITE